MRPFDKGDFGFVVLAQSDFNAGDAAGMNAGAGVVVAGIGGFLFDVRGTDF